MKQYPVLGCNLASPVVQPGCGLWIAATAITGWHDCLRTHFTKYGQCGYADFAEQPLRAAVGKIENRIIFLRQLTRIMQYRY